MAYVNIPDSGLGGVGAKIVGKLLGQVSGGALDTTRELQDKLGLSGCPNPRANNRLKGKQRELTTTMVKANKKLQKFQRLPKKLKVVVKALKAAKKIILTLPIPQAVPPGIGLPINITTKYADLLHLLKESLKQVEEVVDSIVVVLETPSQQIGDIRDVIGRAETVLKGCDIENALRSEVANGVTTEDNLKAIGLIDENGDYIYSTIGPVLLSTDKKYRGKWTSPRGYQKYDIVSYRRNRWVSTKSHISDERGGRDTGPPPIGPWVEQNQFELDAYNKLFRSIDRLGTSSLAGGQIGESEDEAIKSRLRATLVDFQKTLDSSIAGSEQFTVGPKGEILGVVADNEEQAKFFHTAPNGQVLKLQIKLDPDSPEIAPRRFAVAVDNTGVEVLKGPKSFSSSTEVLLQEIKFRIDNQLP